MTVAGLMGYLDSFSPQEELSIETRDVFSQALVDVTSDITVSGDTLHPSLVIAIETQKFDSGN